MKERYSLTGLDVAIALSGLAVLAGLNFAQLAFSGAGDDPKPGSSPAMQAMTGEMLWAYERWDRRNTAIAVFARGDTAFGWVDGYIDEEAARTDALAWCRRHGPDCDVFEVRRGLVEVDGLERPVTQRLVPIVARVRAIPGPAALAVSGTGAHGVGRGATLNGAAANARAICTSAAAKDRERFLPVNSCEVIRLR